MSSSSTGTTEPPYYILVSHSHLLNSAATGAGLSSTSLGHPIIQYHYADDSPLALLPRTPDEHVIILDHQDTEVDSSSRTKSISRNLAVTGVKVSEAPGAAAAHDELHIKRNDKMYILETSSTADSEEKTNSDASQADLLDAHVTLNRFKQRNTIIRRALEYPEASKGDIVQSPTAVISPSSNSPQYYEVA